MTFVVRLSIDAAGRITAVVERVRTGYKERVQGIEAISACIGRMVHQPGAPREAQRGVERGQ